MTRSYMPHSNGLVEQRVRSPQRSLIFAMLMDQENWLEALPTVLWSLRTTRRASASKTPFEIVYGRTPNLSFTIKL